MTKPRLLLLTSLDGAALERLVAAFRELAGATVISDLAALRAAEINEATTLLSFGSGVIVPPDILSMLRRPAYNLHAASPDFPGRDPHHHAIYRKAPTYGATLHVMTPRVDDGPIIAVENFAVPPGSTPSKLLAQANEAGLRLIEKWGPRLLDAEPPKSIPGLAWGPIKTRRSDFQQLCRITPLIQADEFSRRYAAFDGGAFDNLTLELHGELFRIDKTARAAPDHEEFAEFTETGFRSLLRQLKAGGYRFARYGEEVEGRHVIWRHDVDNSMHRAARLAAIEAEEEASSTYFVNPRCVFYSLLEPEIQRLLGRIRNLGHEIGLHFDAAAYGVENWTLPELEGALARERAILELILDQPIRSVSWHNPDMSNLLTFDADLIGGLVSAYGATLRRDYVYGSDSNGYWRFQPMAEVIAGGHTRLHLLTHPEWWTPEAMPPSERIDRAIMGRAQAGRSCYDTLLAKAGRRNVTG